MPVGPGAGSDAQLVRRVRVVGGRLPVEMECRPAFDYARARHTTTVGPHGARCQTVSVNDTFNTLLAGSDNVSVSSASADHTVFAQQPTDTTADSVDCRLLGVSVHRPALKSGAPRYE